MTRLFQPASSVRQVRLPSWFALLVASILPLLLIQSASAQSLPDFTGLVEENSAAVVNISTVSEPDPRTQQTPFSERELEQMPDFFRHFFGGPSHPSEVAQPSPGVRWVLASLFPKTVMYSPITM